MSALGQKQTSAHVYVMSALPPKPDIRGCAHDVRFVPISDIAPYTRVRSHDKLMGLDVPGRGIV
jgi:hypothetical protein